MTVKRFVSGHVFNFPATPRIFEVGAYVRVLRCSDPVSLSVPPPALAYRSVLALPVPNAKPNGTAGEYFFVFSLKTN